HRAHGDRGHRTVVHRWRDSTDCRIRDARQRTDREHRRAPPAYRDGEAARRDLVRGAGPRRQAGGDRRGLRHEDARRHREERRSVWVLVGGGAGGGAWRGAGGGGAAGGGGRGPPLPPLVKLPIAPADITAERRGDHVDLQFTVPSANTDNTRPA